MPPIPTTPSQACAQPSFRYTFHPFLHPSVPLLCQHLKVTAPCSQPTAPCNKCTTTTIKNNMCRLPPRHPLSPPLTLATQPFKQQPTRYSWRIAGRYHPADQPGRGMLTGLDRLRQEWPPLARLARRLTRGLRACYDSVAGAAFCISCSRAPAMSSADCAAVM